MLKNSDNSVWGVGGWYSEIGHVKKIDDLKHLKKWVASDIDNRKNTVFFLSGEDFKLEN